MIFSGSTSIRLIFIKTCRKNNGRNFKHVVVIGNIFLPGPEIIPAGLRKDLFKAFEIKKQGFSGSANLDYFELEYGKMG